MLFARAYGLRQRNAVLYAPPPFRKAAYAAFKPHFIASHLIHLGETLIFAADYHAAAETCRSLIHDDGTRRFLEKHDYCWMREYQRRLVEQRVSGSGLRTVRLAICTIAIWAPVRNVGAYLP